MTRAERCTRTCMSVLQPTFECLTLSLYFIPRLKQSRAGVHRCESSFQECGIDGRTTGEAHALSRRKMKPATCSGLLIIVLFFATPRVSGQSPPQPRNDSDTWYEFLLKQFKSAQFRLRGLA